MIPEGWVLPSVDLFSGWKMGWGGVPSDGVPPLRLLPPKDFPRKPRKIYNDWSALFTRMEVLLRQSNQLVEQPSPEEILAMYEAFAPVVHDRLKRTTKRADSLRVVSISKRMRVDVDELVPTQG